MAVTVLSGIVGLSLRAPKARGNPESLTPELAALDRHGAMRLAMTEGL